MRRLGAASTCWRRGLLRYAAAVVSSKIADLRLKRRTPEPAVGGTKDAAMVSIEPPSCLSEGGQHPPDWESAGHLTRAWSADERAVRLFVAAWTGWTHLATMTSGPGVSGA